MLIKRLFHTSALILMLTGCQHSVKKPEQPTIATAASAEEQVSQLAAIVAGGIYLKQQCQDSATPDREALFARAQALAEQRGWDMHTHARQMLVAQSERFYQGLLNDTTPLSDQCEYFKRHIGPLVENR